MEELKKLLGQQIQTICTNLLSNNKKYSYILYNKWQNGEQCLERHKQLPQYNIFKSPLISFSLNTLISIKGWIFQMFSARWIFFKPFTLQGVPIIRASYEEGMSTCSFSKEVHINIHHFMESPEPAACWDTCKTQWFSFAFLFCLHQ